MKGCKQVRVVERKGGKEKRAVKRKDGKEKGWLRYRVIKEKSVYKHSFVAILLSYFFPFKFCSSKSINLCMHRLNELR